jgi:hypothetical protein
MRSSTHNHRITAARHARHALRNAGGGNQTKGNSKMETNEQAVENYLLSLENKALRLGLLRLSARVEGHLPRSDDPLDEPTAEQLALAADFAESERIISEIIAEIRAA